MSLRCPVHTCQRVMPGTQTICAACQADIARALDAAVWLLGGDLDVALSKQTSKTGGGRSSEAPLPFSESASDAGHELRATIAAWRDELASGLTPREGPTHAGCAHTSCRALVYSYGPGDTWTGSITWLLSGLQRLVRHPEAATAHEQITGAVWLAERAVDRRADRWYAGPCGAELDDGTACLQHLYARPGASTVQCPACRTLWNLDTRREKLLAQIVDQLATATQAAHILTELAAPVKADLVRKWHERGRLASHGHDPRGHPLYVVGDVLDLLVEKLEREEQAAAKRRAAGQERMAS